MKSTHKCPVVEVKMEKHPNADTLSVVRVDEYTVGVKTEDWVRHQWRNKEGKCYGIYIPPDSVVDITRPEFVFLSGLSKDGKTARITVKKFRGIQSFGLLIPAPDDAVLGEDYVEKLGVTHYEPEMQITMGGNNERPPSALVSIPKYDVDTARKYGHLFTPGEIVFITEKVHGANATYVWLDGRIWVKSRTFWKAQDEKCPWWRAYHNTPSIEKFCRENPGCRIHGEILGVQPLRYGFTPGNTGFAAFDITDESGKYLDAAEFLATAKMYKIPTVPIMGFFTWNNFDEIAMMAEGKTRWPGVDHTKEGIVIVPEHERWNEEIGRVKLKIVGFGYLEKS